MQVYMSCFELLTSFLLRSDLTINEHISTKNERIENQQLLSVNFTQHILDYLKSFNCIAIYYTKTLFKVVYCIHIVHIIIYNTGRFHFSTSTWEAFYILVTHNNNNNHHYHHHVETQFSTIEIIPSLVLLWGTQGPF